MTTDSDHICFSQIEFAQVTDKGLQDVSILTIGEAAGHGVVVDEKTIQDFIKLSMGKTIPAYLTHDGAVDAETGRPADRLGKEIGMFSGFYRDGNKVRAKNFQFLEAFKTAEPKTYATLVEMAKNFAENLGISPVMRTVSAWVTKAGEVIANDDSVPAGALDKMPALRVRDLLSCDFVQKPAANLGLFEAKVDGKSSTKPESMSAETILLSKHTEEVTSLQTQHKDAITALETKHKEAVTALQAKLDEAVSQSAKFKEESAGLTSALAAKTKEAEEAAKYDMRKAGAPALQIALETRQGNIPTPAATDKEKWEQYTALCELQKDDRGNVISTKETPNAKRFKELHLTRK
jgi:hypothetical protein